MSARNSTEAAESITWQTAAVTLGLVGLDLRQSADPRALSRLVNARFRNEQTVERRTGYVGRLVRDDSSYPQALNGSTKQTTALNSTGWIYGYGQRLDTLFGTTPNDCHYPQPQCARGVFDYNDGQVVWTGDRLLVMRDDGPALGQSVFWNTGGSATPLAYGIPAYLPVQTDSAPPDTVTGNYTETCLTDTYRVTVATGGSALTAWVTNRDTGVLISKATLGGGSAPVDVRLLKSGAYVMCVWRDTGNTNLYTNYWTGSAWTGAVTVDTGVNALDVALIDGGFHLLWRVSGALYMGKYSGATTQNTPYTFRTALTTTGNAPNGPVALAVSPTDGAVRVVWQASDGLKSRDYSAGLAAGTQFTLDAGTTWDCGLTVSCRRITSGALGTVNRFVVHAGITLGAIGGARGCVLIWETESSTIVRTTTRYNANLASKSFVVGDEVFCWLRARNSGTLFLFAGAYQPQMSGIADREEAAVRAVSGGVQALSMLNPDPRDPYKFTWARPYNTGQPYTRAGNVRIGDINFLPRFSAVRYGKSAYLAGSLVRNWDGSELGDAGFHDYPVVDQIIYPGSGGGGLTGLGKAYQYRVYAVRYNRAGERFQSAAVTAIISGNIYTVLTVTIATLPATNSSDVVYEVYRTEADGTTFYLEGTIANTFAAVQVTFTSTMSDAVLITQQADPHETGVAGADEVEEFGPLGCEFLAVGADRLWGAGGQVPRGQVQFSKLKESGEGAGFDALAGWQEVDCQGGEITSIAGFADSALVVFERHQLYVLFGQGPDNFGNGSFSTPQLTLADGAINHAGTIVTQDGVLYWGTDGPRMLSPDFKVHPIADPVLSLTQTMAPSGAQVDLARREVVWFTEDGNAVLLNYAGQQPRWAQWTGLHIAGACQSALVTTDGVLLIEDADAIGDNGVPFEFAGATGELDAEQILLGRTMVREVGVIGKYLGPHRLRMRIYYNGSPMWSEQQVWSPAANTWLQAVDDVADLTPAQVDALNARDQSGKYEMHKRTTRHECASFRLEWTDISAFRPTYQLTRLVFELGARGGLVRQAPSTFTRS